jgi:WhiB family transcriptional regulator, redox-sensing transcriptional regulator
MVRTKTVAVIDLDSSVGDIGALVRYLEPAWAKDARCREHPDVNFFPGRGESSAAAKAVCRGCAVRAECLDYAVSDPELTGIWGATSRQERQSLAPRGSDDARARSRARRSAAQRARRRREAG